jgi:hypothetical protein
MITPVINAKIILNVYPALTIPNAVAQAGGCSISVIAIKNIEVSTVNEKIIIEAIGDETGINANSIPTGSYYVSSNDISSISNKIRWSNKNNKYGST